VLEGLIHRVLERHGDPNVETAPHKGQPESFTRIGGNLNTEATVYALARLIDHLGMLELLDE
jgi:hypothetical protein